MMVIVTENVAPRLRGRLTVWMLEIRAGVYVGNCDKRQRERVWQRVKDEIDFENQGNAVIAWRAPNEAGYRFDTHGENRRMPVDCDGMDLIAFKPMEPDRFSKESLEEEETQMM